MITLYPEQLNAHISKSLHTAYLLFGNDHFLIQESYDIIYKAAITQGFIGYHFYDLDKNVDWQEIFSICQTTNLFAMRQVIKLLLPENGFNTTINERLVKLVNLLHSDLLLIICSFNFIKIKKNTSWFLALSPVLVQIICLTPRQKDLFFWVNMRAKKNNLQLDDDACQLLCYYYEGNLSALNQILEMLSLLWPNDKITLYHIEQIVNDATRFTPFHWVNALLMAKDLRALHILQQLRSADNEPAILIHILQRELLLLMNIKYHLIYEPLHMLFKKYKVWQNRQEIIVEALNQYNKVQLHYIVHLLTRAEVTLKRDYNPLIWDELEKISLIMCHKNLKDVFIYD